jgi:hypothetical protein
MSILRKASRLSSSKVSFETLILACLLRDHRDANGGRFGQLQSRPGRSFRPRLGPAPAVGAPVGIRVVRASEGAVLASRLGLDRAFHVLLATGAVQQVVVPARSGARRALALRLGRRVRRLRIGRARVLQRVRLGRASWLTFRGARAERQYGGGAER